MEQVISTWGRFEHGWSGVGKLRSKRRCSISKYLPSSVNACFCTALVEARRLQTSVDVALLLRIDFKYLSSINYLFTFYTGIKYLKSRRGKVIMMVNTFPFCEESKLRDKVIWRCTSKKTNCKARIHMLGTNVVAVKGMHNHPPRAPTS
ncbi:modifier of mdg4 isoform A [Danaus plexippus plexippus]|uniref:Modifier of mdg4 isoform A n=1 Tax=Danaus plexippus plexippus TaxID=278856 RepID=A0A212F306_DANPL|nr:modifier of mdg4 isoform A [Danaus plexippus plexippus]